MLKIEIWAVGKLKEPHWQMAAAEFLKRLKPFAKLTCQEIAPSPLTETVTAAQARREEGERLLRRLPDDAFVVALDRRGDALASEKFAAWLADAGGAGRTLAFVIGGAAGLDEAVLRRAQKRLSFSELTFTHEMARLLLLEQLYRGATILAGKKYHY